MTALPAPRPSAMSALFAGRDPAIFTLFELLEKLVRRCGPFKVVADKTRIVFEARRPFLIVSPRQMHLIGQLVLDRRLPHPRFQKIGTTPEGRVAHHFCLERPDELDAQFEEWIREAYAVGSA
ncbi:MAG: DUF5655 domain-containing protein [Acidobacteriota bacterium]